MTRRILLVLLTFTAAVLVGAVVPLTLDAASHDRTSFIQATAGMARTDAAIAQSRLDALASSPPSSSADGGQGKADPALLVLIDQTKQIGDGLLILSGPPQDDNRLVDNGMPPGNWVRLAIQAERAGSAREEVRANRWSRSPRPPGHESPPPCPSTGAVGTGWSAS